MIPRVLPAVPIGLLLAAGCSREPPFPEQTTTLAAGPTFVGRDTCAACHAAEFESFQGSHHDLAMQSATPETVLGDFDDASHEHYGMTSRFFIRDGSFIVETDGPDGAPREFTIAYTFGVEPLQQYLVELDGGRLQALPLCWDSRPAAQGGQRWFHLYPDEPITHTDPLHWTGRNQNWNFMCAECHSTGLDKNYDLASDTFDTTWFEIDISCEACHGPGSEHVAWANAGAADDRDKGLAVDLARPDQWQWVFTEASPTASRIEPRTDHAEIETCARCHSRRAAVTTDYEHGRAILDSHRVSLLSEPEYFADGQVLEENYVYGSFLQSKMHAAGVTCADCHDPHSATLVATGNDLCYRCHLPNTFGVASHHHHPGAAGAAGTNCVDCHMPERHYMVVDGRRDHSFRVPRPDLSAQLGTPNACDACHADQQAGWAAARVAEWYGDDRRQEWRFGEALHAGREGQPGAGALLTRLASDPEQPAIARATGFTLLGSNPAAGILETIRAGLADPDPLVRFGALSAVAALPPEQRPTLAGAQLSDPVRTVRTEAARVLAASVSATSPAALRSAFDQAAAEFIAAQLANAERPESHINLGVFHTDRGDLDAADRAYADALRLDPGNVAAAVNLADLRRVQGRDAEGERLLRDALRRSPQHAAARHALGLTLIRLGRRDEALTELGRAFEWGPENPRHGYVYAVALDSLGQPDRAIEIMRETLAEHPYDRDTLAALVQWCQVRGHADEASGYARRLNALTQTP